MIGIPDGFKDARQHAVLAARWVPWLREKLAEL